MAFDTNMNTPGDNEKRAGQRNEIQVIAPGMHYPAEVTQDKNVIRQRHRAQTQGDFGVMPMPPGGDKRGCQGHCAHEHPKRQNHP